VGEEGEEVGKGGGRWGKVGKCGDRSGEGRERWGKVGGFSTDRKLSQQWPNAFSSVSLADSKLFQHLFHQTQSVFHQFFNSPNMFSFFNRPEVFPTVFQKTQVVSDCFSNKPKALIIIKKTQQFQQVFNRLKVVSTVSFFNRPQALSRVLVTDPKLFQQLFQQTQLF
jgi:hypothetical protein